MGILLEILTEKGTKFMSSMLPAGTLPDAWNEVDHSQSLSSSDRQLGRAR